jgi:ABC-type amino acid transport substrate-binding protein
MMLPQLVLAEAPAQGKDQLVDALDAAFIRVVDSGQWREIMDDDTLGGGPLAVNVADCYPNVAEAPFPQNPTGLLADILDSKQIRVGTYTSVYPISADIFEEINEKLMRAIIDELGKGYGLSSGTIEIVPVDVWPPSSGLLFSMLNNGDFDITNFNAALGGTSSDQRRRKLARFTCTVFASNWYIHVKDSSLYHTMKDLQADTNATICSGMLSARLSKAYFKDQTLVDQYESDLERCSAGVDNGTYDAYLYFGQEPALPGLRSIAMGIVSGVPIWVAGGPDSPSDKTTICPLSTALGNNEELDLLRKLRDTRLKNNRAMKLVTLYYANAPAVSQILADNAMLKERLRDLIVENMSITEKLLTKGHATVGKKVINKATNYLNELKMKGSPKLKADIDLLIRGIKDRHLLDAIGVSIAQ